MMSFFSEGFEAFAEADFDAFAEPKWSSNRFNLERMRVAERLRLLERRLTAALAPHAEGTEVGATDARPTVFNGNKVDALWIWRVRDESTRRLLDRLLDRGASLVERVEDPAEHHRHTVLALRIDAAGIQAGVYLHGNARVDIENLVAVRKEAFERDKLARLLAHAASLGTRPMSLDLGQEGSLPLPVLAAATWPDVLGKRLSPHGAGLWCGTSWAREECLAGGAAFVGELGDRFAALGPLYAALSWSRTNDAAGFADRVKQERTGRGAPSHDEPPALRPVSRSQPASSASPSQPSRAPMAPPPPSKGLELKQGGHVRITSGLFAGKTGVLLAFEGKSDAKVDLSGMAMKLPIKDLQAIESPAPPPQRPVPGAFDGRGPDPRDARRDGRGPRFDDRRGPPGPPRDDHRGPPQGRVDGRPPYGRGDGRRG